MSLSPSNFAEEVIQCFEVNSNDGLAIKMAAYMRNKFKFYGIPAPVRYKLCRELYAKYGIPEDAFAVAHLLWAQPHRELHYVAQELVLKTHKQWRLEHIEDIERLIINNSWWDTIDFLASNIVGKYFKKWPKFSQQVIGQWNKSENFWLVRTSILFQLRYKHKTDIGLLTACILSNADNKDFFVKKAIGWALREYAKINPKWVQLFLDKHTLQSLSAREAQKYLKSNLK